MRLALTQQITQADSDLEHCHIIICSEGCTVFHLFLLSRSHKQACVHPHVPKQSLVHGCEQYKEHGAFYIWMSLSLLFFWDSFGEHEVHFSGAHGPLLPHPSVELSSRAAQAGSCSKSIELLRVFNDLPNQHGCTLGPVIDFCPCTQRQQFCTMLQLRS